MHMLDYNIRTKSGGFISKDYSQRSIHAGDKYIRLKIWTFIAAWGGKWMWRDIVNSDKPKDNCSGSQME